MGRITGFDWDRGNTDKNWRSHGVSNQEAEDVFSSARLRLMADTEHSVAERRYAAHGTSAAGRQLAVFFTIRGSQIRIISARDMSRKERRDYGKN